MRAVLFLRQDPDAGGLVIVGGPYGAFLEQDQRIQSFLVKGSEMEQKYHGLDVAAFRDLVAQAVSDR
jgi:hypothetical protein